MSANDIVLTVGLKKKCSYHTYQKMCF